MTYQEILHKVGDENLAFVIVFLRAQGTFEHCLGKIDLVDVKEGSGKYDLVIANNRSALSFTNFCDEGCFVVFNGWTDEVRRLPEFDFIVEFGQFVIFRHKGYRELLL